MPSSNLDNQKENKPNCIDSLYHPLGSDVVPTLWSKHLSKDKRRETKTRAEVATVGKLFSVLGLLMNGAAVSSRATSEQNIYRLRTLASCILHLPPFSRRRLGQAPYVAARCLGEAAPRRNGASHGGGHSRGHAPAVDAGAGECTRLSSSFLSRSSGHGYDAKMIPGMAAPSLDFFFFFS